MARFTGGWIKLYHSILDHPVSQHGAFTFGIFTKILLWANWKESSVIFGGKKITLKPGQLVTGLRELSPDKDEDPYLNKVRASLDYLVLCEALEQVSNNQGRLITVRNWDKYQGREFESDVTTTSEAQIDHKQTTSRPQLSEEYKKVRKEEERDLPQEILKCEESWGKTLARFEIPRKPSEDREHIGRLIQRHGFEKTCLALLGAGFEEKSQDYDPAKHVSIYRLVQKPALVDKFANLGAKAEKTEQAAPKTRKWGG